VVKALGGGLRRASAVLWEFLRPDSAPDRSVPTLDGGFAPNEELEALPTLAPLEGPRDVLAVDDHRAAVSAGRALYLVDVRDGGLRPLAALDGEVTGLALRGREVLACVQGAGLFCHDLDGGTTRAVVTAADGPLTNLSSVAVVGERVFVARPSDRYSTAEWPHDLMRKRATGSVYELGVDGRLTRVLDGLGWVGGLAAHQGSLLVSESWAHRVIRLDPGTGRTTPFQRRLPGYPARLAASAEGGVLIALFALRTQLVEFVLREDEFRTAMIEQIPVEDWIRPAHRSTTSVRQPFQFGSVVHLSEVKPWSPPRSYGLVAELGPEGEVRHSMHSRNGGTKHGVTALAQVGSALVIACHGNDELLVRRGET
jgi:hypothetical protein